MSLFAAIYVQCMYVCMCVCVCGGGGGVRECVRAFCCFLRPCQQYFSYIEPSPRKWESEKYMLDKKLHPTLDLASSRAGTFLPKANDYRTNSSNFLADWRTTLLPVCVPACVSV